MSKAEFRGKFFTVTHTIEKEGPHLTIPHEYYDDTFTISILLKGKGTCYIEGNTYSLNEGDFVVLAPDEIRSFKFEQNGYHERMSLYFSYSILSPLWEYELPLMQIFRGIGNKYSSDEKLNSILKNICEIMDDDSISMKEARINLKIIELLFAVYDIPTTDDKALASDTDSLIWDICEYIKGNLSKELSYKHLKEKFLVSRYQLTEVFYRNTGMTLTEYILHKRLMQVTSFVRDGMGIENAAYSAGFHTYSHFYKEFKKRHNISPQKYYKTSRQ